MDRSWGVLWRGVKRHKFQVACTFVHEIVSRTGWHKNQDIGTDRAPHAAYKCLTGGSYSNCSDHSQPGVSGVFAYLDTLPYKTFQNGD
jgi:hypothetical protein